MVFANTITSKNFEENAFKIDIKRKVKVTYAPVYTSLESKLSDKSMIILQLQSRSY